MQAVLPFLAVLIAGLGIAIETPINAFLTKTSASAVWAALLSFGAGGAVLAAAALAYRPQLAAGWVARTPWWAWTGGVWGAAVVALAAWATPKLGAGTALVVIVAAQVALGVLLDHFGLLGLEVHSAGWLRIGGIAMVIAGALLVAFG